MTITDEMVERAMLELQKHKPFHMSATAMRACLFVAFVVTQSMVDEAVEIIFGDTNFRPYWMKATVRAALEAALSAKDRPND